MYCPTPKLKKDVGNPLLTHVQEIHSSLPTWESFRKGFRHNSAS